MERVGIYNRCSTEEESQLNALATQVLESREIAERNGWQVIEQYVESQTGTVAYKRREYQRLLVDMERNKFDIVMIKSIDRLMRSAKDWYFFLSRLTENGLKLYIYIEGKFYTTDDNLIAGIKAILAEDFSRELSKKIKNAHRRRQEKKSGCNITCAMFGWDKAGRDLYVVNEQEAEWYRTAFALAKEGKGFYTISNILYDLGARGKKGQKISEVQWRKMLYTPRAHGTVVLNTRTYNFDTKKYEEVPEKDWVIMENALPAIVSREYQEEVIELMRKRASGSRAKKSRTVHTGSGKYELSGKLQCAECGRYYYRTCYHSKAGKKTIWKCATFLENGRTDKGKRAGGCDNINLSEDNIFKSVEAALQNHCELLLGEEDKIVREFMRLLRKVMKEQAGKEELKRLEKEYQKLAHRREILLEKLLNGVIQDEDFKRYHEELADKINDMEARIDSIKQACLSYNHCETRLTAISQAVRQEGLIQKAQIKAALKDIHHIQVHRDGRLLVYFDEEGLTREEAWYRVTF